MRLVMLCHGATAATRAGRFPGEDDPLEAAARDAVGTMRPRWPRRALTLASPMLSARQTAAALGLDVAPEAALRDADPGRWAGRTPAEVEAASPGAFQSWLADPEVAPPGGESRADVHRRVSAWLSGRLAFPEPVLAVTHAAVIRAAVAAVLGAPAAASRAVDVPPLATATFSSDGRRWTLVSLVPP